MRSWRWLLMLTAFCWVSCDLMAVAERKELELPLSLSPLRDPGRFAKDGRRLILGLHFIEGLAEDVQSRSQQTTISGALYELAYHDLFWDSLISWQPRLRYREIHYQYDQLSNLLGQVFRSRSTNDFWETYLASNLQVFTGNGLSFGWQPEMVWVNQAFKADFFADDQQFSYYRQSWQVHWALEKWLLGLSYRTPVQLLGPTYQIRQAANQSLEILWRQLAMLAWGLKVEHRQNKRQDARLRDSWLFALGGEYQYNSNWQWAIYNEFQPAFYRKGVDATSNNIASAALHIALEFMAYEDTNISLGIRLSQAEYRSSGRRIDYQSQSIQIQFDHFLF